MLPSASMPSQSRLRQWTSLGVCLLLAFGSTGCLSHRASSTSTSSPRHPPLLVRLSAALRAGLTRADAPCHLPAGMLTQPLAVESNRLQVALDPAQGYALSLSPSAQCLLSADQAVVGFCIDQQGCARLTSVTMSGSPAVVRDSAGHTVLVGSRITLHLGRLGLDGVELPGDGGALLMVPSAWEAPRS